MIFFYFDAASDEDREQLVFKKMCDPPNQVEKHRDYFGLEGKNLMITTPKCAIC